MGPLIVVASAVQWTSGLALAYLIIRRARQHGRAGNGPRAFAMLAVALFLAGAVELAFVLSGVRITPSSWLPPDFTAGHWQLITLLLFSVAAWVAVLVAAVWNGINGINTRRRIASAELRRRTERALHPGHGRSGPGS